MGNDIPTYIGFTICISNLALKFTEKIAHYSGQLQCKKYLPSHYKAMSLQISGIIQLEHPLINVVGHFMSCLNTKHTFLHINMPMSIWVL